MLDTLHIVWKTQKVPVLRLCQFHQLFLRGQTIVDFCVVDRPLTPVPHHFQNSAQFHTWNRNLNAIWEIAQIPVIPIIKLAWKPSFRIFWKPKLMFKRLENGRQIAWKSHKCRFMVILFRKDCSTNRMSLLHHESMPTWEISPNNRRNLEDFSHFTHVYNWPEIASYSSSRGTILVSNFSSSVFSILSIKVMTFGLSL